MIYIDQPTLARDGRNWRHLSTDDEDMAELHLMAYRIGLKRGWFQPMLDFPHYDIVSKKIAQRAILLGAQEITGKEMVRKVLWVRRARRLAKETAGG